MIRWFMRSRSEDQEKLEITASIKALKTLTFRHGRVSIAPSEVLSQPGYIEERKRAAELVQGLKPSTFEQGKDARWEDFDSLSSSEISTLFSSKLQCAREEGKTLTDALEQLKNLQSWTSP